MSVELRRDLTNTCHTVLLSLVVDGRSSVRHALTLVEAPF